MLLLVCATISTQTNDVVTGLTSVATFEINGTDIYTTEVEPGKISVADISGATPHLLLP
jgi:hypothetical protein